VPDNSAANTHSVKRIRCYTDVTSDRYDEMRPRAVCYPRLGLIGVEPWGKPWKSFEQALEKVVLQDRSRPRKDGLVSQWERHMDRKTQINMWYILAALAGFMLVQGRDFRFSPDSDQTAAPY
jgi:hypothetical protein